MNNREQAINKTVEILKKWGTICQRDFNEVANEIDAGYRLPEPQGELTREKIAKLLAYQDVRGKSEYQDKTVEQVWEAVLNEKIDDEYLEDADQILALKPPVSQEQVEAIAKRICTLNPKVNDWSQLDDSQKESWLAESREVLSLVSPVSLPVLIENKKYVVGFLFNNSKLALIKKNRPEWQRGKLNGIGGHIKVGETPLEAMKREFSEEASDFINEWEYYCTMNYPEADVYVFRLFGDYKIETKTDEIIAWYPVDDLPRTVIANLNWLIPLAHYDDEYLKQVSFQPQVALIKQVNNIKE